jgi:Uma2 family endonuclease
MEKEGENMAMPIKENKKTFTYSDYLAWPDSERWQLIDGEPYAMSPAPSRIHQEIIGELFLQIGGYLRGKGCRAYVAPFDVVLVDENNDRESSKNVVQPDITIVCDKEKLDDKGCKGSPDMVIEVVSPSTASQDYVKKLNLYEKYLIKEYWIVNPKNNNIFVYKLDENNQYSEIKVYDIKERVQVGIFKDLIIDLSQIE